MDKVSKDMTIAQVLQMDRKGIAPILMEKGLHCLACPVSSRESIEQACGVHGIDLNEMLDDINGYLEGK